MKSSNNLHAIYVYGQPLGVECKGCGRRALDFADRDLDGFRADMRELRTLRFVCSKCGSREWAGWLFINATERDAWIEGLIVSPVDRSRPAF
ncbi:MAG: hypothetical protein J0J01_19795 [Reyranella sp.]|uniref:hypothetical protein n=1 Tax=Reyranella sp. TaxID=1929291 RepID=UPI001ACA9879|nr:hypothetical protein [Reyranella sp.]MBN9089155.1 hypothetical protein [Reyranella sp.]